MLDTVIKINKDTQDYNYLINDVLEVLYIPTDDGKFDIELIFDESQIAEADARSLSDAFLNLVLNIK